MTIIIPIFIFLIILLISVTFHEYSHGWAAAKLGDPTPKYSGRLTLNPLAHIDLFGTVIMPILLLTVSHVIFAYAKPVPINPYHFKNPKRDLRLVSIAGPGVNILLALFFTFMLKTGVFPFADILVLGIRINLILAILNLMPIPPLDGSKIVASLLPNRMAVNYLKIDTYGFLIIILLIVVGFFKEIFFPFVDSMLSFLLKMAS